jgi:hypothetical protein
VRIAFLKLRIAQEKGDKAKAVVQLLGPVHGTLQTIRGMCSDGLTLEEIDVKLAELDARVYETAAMLGHGR